VQRIEVPVIDTRRTDVGNPYWIETRGRAMGSTVHMVVGDAPDGVMTWAVNELERLEECWSRFRPTSELSRVNARAGEWVDVSASMVLVLGCAADLHRVTDGRFDPTILNALEAVGYDRTFDLVATDDDTPVSLVDVPGFASVDIDETNSRVRVPVGTRLDLGGIGKGLAADLITRGLIDRGARHALVSLGGDLRARGQAGSAPGWMIPVEDPRDARNVLFRHPLDDGAIVTSTTRLRTWTRASRRYHHLIDPTTGASTERGVAAVVATARDAWWAEGIAKAIVVAGGVAGAPLAHACGVRAWIVLEDGSVIDTDRDV
jgi:thiamine biosynthesis lipoprotein